MTAAPMISVIIPCRNHGHLLREAIDSVGAPSRPVEIVIVNDGSTDNSAEMAEEHARDRSNGRSVQVVHQAGAGISAARNCGFAKCRGEYVVFLDADDHLAPNALDIGVRALNEHPESVFVYGRCKMMAVDGTLLPTPQQPRIVHHAYHELLRRNYIWTPANVMFRREALIRYGTFNPEVSGAADYELYLRLARTNPIHDHGQLVTHYRRHDGGTSESAAEMLRETLTVLRSQWPYVVGDPDAMTAYREGWRNWQEFYGSQLLNEISAAVRERDWWPAVQKAVVLAVLHPRGVAHQAGRRLRRVGATRVLKRAPGI